MTLDLDIEPSFVLLKKNPAVSQENVTHRETPNLRKRAWRTPKCGKDQQMLTDLGLS